MFHIIYKTTNTVNNKIYVGYHFQESDPFAFDGYLGSGKGILKAIKKYGRYKFIRETLHVFTTEHDALSKETEIVNESFIMRSDVYNLVPGGGKPPSHKGKKKTENHKKKIGCSQKGKVISIAQRDKTSTTLTGRKVGPHSVERKKNIANALLGVKHTEERKQKMSDNHADMSGAKNPMFGKIGPANPNFGRKDSSTAKLRKKQAALESQVIVECPHCKKIGKRSGMQVWHFDRCRKLKR